MVVTAIVVDGRPDNQLPVGTRRGADKKGEKQDRPIPQPAKADEEPGAHKWRTECVLVIRMEHSEVPAEIWRIEMSEVGKTFPRVGFRGPRHSRQYRPRTASCWQTLTISNSADNSSAPNVTVVPASNRVIAEQRPNSPADHAGPPHHDGDTSNIHRVSPDAAWVKVGGRPYRWSKTRDVWRNAVQSPLPPGEAG